MEKAYLLILIDSKSHKTNAAVFSSIENAMSAIKEEHSRQSDLDCPEHVAWKIVRFDVDDTTGGTLIQVGSFHVLARKQNNVSIEQDASQESCATRFDEVYAERVRRENCVSESLGLCHTLHVHEVSSYHQKRREKLRRYVGSTTSLLQRPQNIRHINQWSNIPQRSECV